MTLKESTYYILDAQGNPLATYVFNAAGGPTSYYLTERNIYGSDRLGMTRDTVNMFNPNTLPSYGVLGNRNYELKNHLGNVLAVINDFNIPQDENSDNTVDTYHAGIESIYDYSPFGVQLNGRTIERQYVSPPPDTTYSTGTAYLDSSDFENPVVVMSGSDTLSVAGWSHWSTSDLTLETINGSQRLKVTSRNVNIGTHQSFDVTPGTTYTLSIDLYRNQSTPPPPIEWPPIVSSSATNNTQNLNEQYGLADSTGTGNPLNASTNAVGGASMNTLSSVPSVVNIVIWESATGGSGVGTTVYQMFNDGTNTFTYTAVSEDIFIQIRQFGEYYVDNIFISYPDTVAHITQAPTPKNYRYGFNGMERDNEVSGAGNSYDFGARMYNPRVGRWMSVDPSQAKYPDQSPYSSFNNNPNYFVDPDGKDGIAVVVKNKDGTGGTVFIIATYYVVKGNVENNGFTEEQIKALDELDETLNSQNPTITKNIEYNGQNLKGYNVQFVFNIKEVNSLEDAQKGRGGVFEGVQTSNTTFSLPVGKNGTIMLEPNNLIANYTSKEFKGLHGVKATAETHGVSVKNLAAITGGDKRTDIADQQGVIAQESSGGNFVTNMLHEIFHTLFTDKDEAYKGVGKGNTTTLEYGDVNDVIKSLISKGRARYGTDKPTKQ